MITTADNTVDALPTIVNGAKTTQVAAFGRFANKAAVNTIFQYNVPCMAIQVFQDVVGGLFEVIDEKISQALTSDIRSLVLNYTPSRYFDRELCREKLAAFFERLHNREHMKVVFYGDSITNFQNSEMLTVEEQKTSPIGLAGNSWLRQIWQMLNYDVFNDDRTVKSVNGNLGS